MDLVAPDFSSWLMILQTFETFSHLASNQNVTHTQRTKRKSALYLADIMEAEFDGPIDDDQVRKIHKFETLLQNKHMSKSYKIKCINIMFFIR